MTFGTTTRLSDEDAAYYYEQARKAVGMMPTQSADELAEYFNSIGITGICGDASRCAISEYMQRSVPAPEGYRWHVGMSSAMLLGHANNQMVTPVVAYFTPNQSDFVALFDAEKYPDLVKESDG